MKKLHVDVLPQTPHVTVTAYMSKCNFSQKFYIEWERLLLTFFLLLLLLGTVKGNTLNRNKAKKGGVTVILYDQKLEDTGPSDLVHT